MIKVKLALLLLSLSACDFNIPQPYEGEGLAGRRVTGGCPEDEKCSSSAPDGLRLRSLSMAELPYITALDGTQSFLVESPTGEANQVPYTVELHSNIMEIVDISPGQFTIRGNGTTSSVGAILSLRETESGTLLDRFRLPVKAIDSVLLLPLTDEGFFSFGVHAVFVGSTSNLTAQLNSPDYTKSIFGDEIGEAISDESLQLRASEDSGSLFTLQQPVWNQGILLAGQTVGSGTVELQTGSGTLYEFPLSVVDRISSIVLFGISSIDLVKPAKICAFLQSEFGRVIGVPLVFEIDGPAEFVRDDDIDCINVTMTEAEEALLTVTGDGQSASLTLQGVE